MPGPLSVTLTSNNAAATVTGSPQSVPAGATTATFTISTTAVLADTPVTITPMPANTRNIDRARAGRKPTLDARWSRAPGTSRSPCWRSSTNT